MNKIHIHKIHELSSLFPPETAGRDMITDIPVFSRSVTATEARTEIVSHASSYGSVNYLYITNKEGELLGVISMRELLLASPSAKLESLMTKKTIFAKPMDNVAHVALLSLRHQLKMIPIVDHKQRLVGAYSSDQLLEILNKEFSNDLLRLSGVTFSRKHFSFDSVRIFYRRAPWMIVGMLGGLVTGSIIASYKESLEAVIILAAFIPVIMSTGATSANQSAMIFVRNLIHGDIKNTTIYLLNELKIASLLGFGLSVVLYSILLFLLGNFALAIAVSVSLGLTIVAAAVIGVMTPFLLNKFKLDPSIGAGPFLTIVKDIIAMSIYFSVATALLEHLI
jgi:magnesium transporter